MSRTRMLGIAALCGLIVLAVFAEVPGFTPDSTFKGSSLSGWHVLGDADWSARDGEITGNAKAGGKGGWLVLDQSYQDAGFYASFRCAAGCATGLLLRAEKTPQGMKGLYVALSGEPGLFR